MQAIEWDDELSEMTGVDPRVSAEAVHGRESERGCMSGASGAGASAQCERHVCVKLVCGSVCVSSLM